MTYAQCSRCSVVRPSEAIEGGLCTDVDQCNQAKKDGAFFSQWIDYLTVEEIVRSEMNALDRWIGFTPP